MHAQSRFKVQTNRPHTGQMISLALATGMWQAWLAN